MISNNNRNCISNSYDKVSINEIITRLLIEIALKVMIMVNIITK